ncbi:MAG: ferredoxin [Umezawaea sp.]
MRVRVDPDRCVASGQCVVYAGKVFKQSEQEGTVELVQASPPPSLHAAVLEAQALCPSGAIVTES